MEITQFIASNRNDALLLGDYGSYRRQLSRRLPKLRAKLGRATPKGKKFTSRAPITVEEISSNPEFIQLILLTSERAWAHAMYMKSMHATDSSEKAITGSTRTHIISRLQKAKISTDQLVELLRQRGHSGTLGTELLEAMAYRSMLWGTMKFEAQKWEASLKAFSEVHLIYSVLAGKSNSSLAENFRGLVSSVVEASVRYAAYQIQIPRTLPISRIVAKLASRESEAIQQLLKLEPKALDTGEAEAGPEKGLEGKDLPKTISWRSRVVKLEDASIAQALAAVSTAEEKLASLLASARGMLSKEKAAAFDEVLNPSQDAVDATKTAIDELSADGVAPADSRMQALQVTRTAVNYALVGWRVGRNRVLCGTNDGALLDDGLQQTRNRGKDEFVRAAKEDSNGRKISKLRERVVLYDSILQSLGSVNELPGAAADKQLLTEIDSKRFYFSSLRCLAIARSHALLGNAKNSLALLAQSLNECSRISTFDQPASGSKPPNLDVTKDQVRSLQTTLKGLVLQRQALVQLHSLHDDALAAEKSKAKGAVPLIERLDEYPVDGVDLSNLVVYPPRVRPVPVKPIFLDVAFNYINYPGQEQVKEASISQPAQKTEIKKGWFGFGR